MNALQTFDLLQPIVAALNTQIQASSVNDLGGGNYRVFTCNTLWLTAGEQRKLTIGLNKYDIVDILPNVWVLLKGLATPPLQFNIPLPFFYHGTVLMQNILLNLEGLSDVAAKFPMIWLQEVTKEKWHNEFNTIIERTSDCNIYFLTDADHKQWLQLDHDRYAIKPMRNLAAEFEKVIDKSTPINFNNVVSETGDHANFGKYLSEKGHIEETFSWPLSGVAMRTSIPFQKQKDCKKVCS